MSCEEELGKEGGEMRSWKHRVTHVEKAEKERAGNWGCSIKIEKGSS